MTSRDVPLRPGTRVVVSPAYHWAKGAVGTVTWPPRVLAELGLDDPEWDGWIKTVEAVHGKIRFYWIQFDIDQRDAEGDGPYNGGEIDVNYVEPLVMTDAVNVPSVDVHEAARRLDQGPGGRPPLLVDVREANEYATVRIPGAVLLPLSELQARYAELPRDKPLLIHCAAGKRSLVAAEFLMRNGYPDVTNVEGGIIEWQKAGLPVREGARGPEETD
jgi:rhodanese-related sulfurtransferase